MKRADKSAKSIRNFDQLISKLSENELLNLHEMSCVRGGEADGGEDIIIIPRPPKP